MSGQQVVSYIMGFEDHFTSHKYANLYWPSLEGFINSEHPSPECYRTPRVAVESDIDPPTESADDALPVDGVAAVEALNDTSTVEVVTSIEAVEGEDLNVGMLEREHELLEDFDNAEDGPGSMDDITLTLGLDGKFTATANQTADYQRRGPELEDINIWDFVAQVEKVKMGRAQRNHKKQCGFPEGAEDDDDHDTTYPQMEESLEDASNDQSQPESSWNVEEDGDILQWSGRNPGSDRPCVTPSRS
ncbi:hypothetical protein B0H11DRAFT_1934943 [Mycena galericulata]|nr:hypothetical protein B0H11DRAFT_1934943 [Mycena galericulata]